MKLLGVSRAEGREAALLAASQFSGLEAGCWEQGAGSTALRLLG